MIPSVPVDVITSVENIDVIPPLHSVVLLTVTCKWLSLLDVDFISVEFNLVVLVVIEDNSNAEVLAWIESAGVTVPFEYVDAGSTVVTLIGTTVCSL